jgi:hypothetical protein
LDSEAISTSRQKGSSEPSSAQDNVESWRREALWRELV